MLRKNLSRYLIIARSKKIDSGYCKHISVRKQEAPGLLWQSLGENLENEQHKKIKWIEGTTDNRLHEEWPPLHRKNGVTQKDV